MGGEGTTDVKYRAGKFIPLSNEKIDATKKDQLYADILQRGIKEKKSTIKNSLKDLLKVSMKNRVRNVKTYKANKKALAYLSETATWRALRLIYTPVVETNK